mmetsp:Transcript_31535/g.31023  ORF Transcript_31535/g.31023 Transcript_31535/m.31023 type:complete len:89 (+) Transcript_31535:560-826(+)
MQLSIIRNKSGFNKFHPKYTLAITIAYENGDNLVKEILVGKKRSGNKTSNYLVSLDIKNPKPKGDMYIGKVRATDSRKSQYFIFDDGK